MERSPDNDLPRTRLPAAGSSADGLGFDLDDEAWIGRLRDSVAAPTTDRLGPYELLAEIGRGGQGLVFKARQPGTGREMAIKRLSAGVFSTPEMRARFEREIEAAAALDHPNVVTVFSSDTMPPTAFLVKQPRAAAVQLGADAHQQKKTTRPLDAHPV